MNRASNAPPEPALERLVEQVRAAQADGSALLIRGGGTKDFYGGVLTGKPLELGALRGICSYEPTEMVITARAATPLHELEEALAERGQYLAFEPPRFGARGQTTVGGMVAAGLAGPARAAVGSVRDFVLGACVLNGRGELLRFGGQVMKNVAGYDAARLFAGSMGVLGVICEVSLKVLPVAASCQSMELDCEQAQALRLLHTWARSALPLNASAWHEGILRVRFCGAVAAVRLALERVKKDCAVRILEQDVAQRHWEAQRDQTHEFFAKRDDGAPRPALWRLSVPATHPPLDLSGQILIEWGGAQRWYWTQVPAETVRETAARASGHASVFRAQTRSADFLAPLPGPLERIHRALKQSFDPAGIFNRGRLYPWM